MLSWYVLRTKPNSERLSASGLERNGFEVFAPYVKVPRGNGGSSSVPLFPGYLFLRCDREQPSLSLGQGTPGELKWLRFGGVVPPVPDEAVAALAERIDVINGEGGLWRRFNVGEKVRVVSGKLDNLAEVIEATASPYARVRVFMEIMGRAVQTEVPWRNLRPLDTPDSPSPAHASRRTRGRRRWISGHGPRMVATT